MKERIVIATLTFFCMWLCWSCCSAIDAGVYSHGARELAVGMVACLSGTAAVCGIILSLIWDVLK